MTSEALNYRLVYCFSVLLRVDVMTYVQNIVYLIIFINPSASHVEDLTLDLARCALGNDSLCLIFNRTDECFCADSTKGLLWIMMPRRGSTRYIICHIYIRLVF